VTNVNLYSMNDKLKEMSTYDQIKHSSLRK
jgi:hypothetical protein